MANTAPYKRVRNTDTGEIYEATPDDTWIEKLTVWREAMRACNGDVRKCSIPSPIPAGHTMFLRSVKRRSATYVPAENWLRVVIDVTPDDLVRGREPVAIRNPCKCPIAQAFERQFPNSLPYVNAEGIVYSTPTSANNDIPITDAAVNWMDAFDDGRPVQPGLLVLIDGPYADEDHTRPVAGNPQAPPSSPASAG